MYIVAIAWIYVVLMMSITERTAVAGVMTFLLYGILPLLIILYLMDAPRRKKERARRENTAASAAHPPSPSCGEQRSDFDAGG